MNSSSEGCDYTEPTLSGSSSGSWSSLENKLYFTWASKDEHYKQKVCPTLTTTTDKEVKVWRGERAGFEALLYSKNATEKLALKADVGNSTIDCQPRFMNWVKTDTKEGGGINPNYDASTGKFSDSEAFLVADIIDIETTKALAAETVRPVWVTLEIPRDIAAGSYDVKINVLKASDNSVQGTLNLTVTVCDKTLPEPKDYQYFLNFWQQPYALSRYYAVEKWSDAHMNILRPYLKMMARAGQKVITAIMHEDPWHDAWDQSNDDFDPMIITTKNSDGTYSYNYDILDKWVELNIECGIPAEIHFFSIVPWDNKFTYSNGSLTASPGTEEWTNYLSPYLESLANHLKEKGWMDNAYMALDERTSGVLDAYNLASKYGFKTSLAGLNKSDYIDKLEDYCLEIDKNTVIWSSSEISSRKAKGFRTTVYTCCSATENVPNVIVKNNPADGAYLQIYAIANDCDGYLHWSWCNFTDDPLIDSRFRLWGGGDTYMVYPGGRSGLRFERIMEGVQLAEKVRILRDEYTTAGKTTNLTSLNNMVAKFKSNSVSESTGSSSTGGLVSALQNLVNVTDVPTIVLTDAKREARWLKTVTSTDAVQNINYSASSADNDGYVLCTEELQVNPGQTFSLELVPYSNDDGLQYCRLGAFSDWNCDKDFVMEGDVVGNASQANTALTDYTLTLTVPEDATIGESRIRLIYNDAWADFPATATETVTYGFVFDIPVRVVKSEPVVQGEIGLFLDENSSELSELSGQYSASIPTRTMYLQRTLVQDKWNSLILPVSMTAAQVKAAFGQTVKLASMNSAKASSDGYSISFKIVNLDTDANTVIEAGKPYIIKPGSDMTPLEKGVYSYTDINNQEASLNVSQDCMVFKVADVTYPALTCDDSGLVKQTQYAGSAAIVFAGTYLKQQKDNLIPGGSFVLNDGEWYHIINPISSAAGFRSWIDTSALPSSAKIICNIEDDGPASIEGIETDLEETFPVYDLFGRKIRENGNLQGLPKGIYIINGRKVVIM